MKSNRMYLLLFVVFVSCTGAQENVRRSTGEWIKTERSLYSIMYPDDWQFVEDGRLGSAFMIYTGYEDKNDHFRENIILKITETEEPDMDLDKFVNISENPDPDKVVNSEIYSSERIDGDLFDKHVLVFSAELRGFKYKFKQFYWVVNDSIYVLSYHAQPDKYDKFLSDADSIMNSFILKIK